jgi:hypothetical protein
MKISIMSFDRSSSLPVIYLGGLGSDPVVVSEERLALGLDETSFGDDLLLERLKRGRVLGVFFVFDVS